MTNFRLLISFILIPLISHPPVEFLTIKFTRVVSTNVYRSYWKKRVWSEIGRYEDNVEDTLI